MKQNLIKTSRSGKLILPQGEVSLFARGKLGKLAEKAGSPFFPPIFTGATKLKTSAESILSLGTTARPPAVAI